MARIFYDTFTGSDATTLPSHTPDEGTSWSNFYQSGAGFNMQILTNQVTSEGGLSDGVACTANTTYTNHNYYIQCVFNAAGAGDPLYLFLRVIDSNNLYAVYINGAAGSAGTSRIYRKTSGIWTALGSAFDTPAAGSVCKFEINQFNLSFYDDDVLIENVTDNSITETGKAGIGGGGGAGLITAGDDATSVVLVDNFEVYEGGTDKTYKVNSVNIRPRAFAPGIAR